MKKVVRKILALMVVSILIVPMCVTPVFAASTSGRDFVYTILNDGTIEISGYTGNDTEVVIPSTIDGRFVTSIGNSAFFKNDYITSVTIPYCVKSIGNYAFGYCSLLENITIPSGVNSISQSAFNNSSDDLVINCFTDSTAVTFAQKNGIGYACFSYSVKTDGTAEITCFKGPAKEVVIPDYADGIEVTSIGYTAFLYSSVTSVVIPDSVTNIGDYAFCQCSSLLNINIPDGVTNIGDYAFGYCSSLESITIPESVKMIGSFAFGKCSSLKSVSIPDSVERVLDYAFYRCSSLESAVFSANPKCKYLDSYVFAECPSLTEVTIPANVTYIYDDAFEGSSNLSVVYGDLGSQAQVFAEKYSINFVSING